METGSLKGLKKLVLDKPPTDAAAPQCRVVTQSLRYALVADDVADNGPAAGLQNPEHLVE